MIRVEVVFQLKTEEYDASGNLTASSPAQPVTLAAMSPDALARAWAEAGRQIAAAVWPDADAAPPVVETKAAASKAV